MLVIYFFKIYIVLVLSKKLPQGGTTVFCKMLKLPYQNKNFLDIDISVM